MQRYDAYLGGEHSTPGSKPSVPKTRPSVEALLGQNGVQLDVKLQRLCLSLRLRFKAWG